MAAVFFIDIIERMTFAIVIGNMAQQRGRACDRSRCRVDQSRDRFLGFIVRAARLGFRFRVPWFGRLITKRRQAVRKKGSV